MTYWSRLASGFSPAADRATRLGASVLTRNRLKGGSYSPMGVKVAFRSCLSRAPHTTIMRWVQRYAPEFEKRWRRFARAVGRSWRVDETYVKIRGEWRYLYRAVDRAGRTVDFRLSPRRDVVAAKAFFRKAIKSQQRCPRTITLDGYAASHRAVRELKADGPRTRSCARRNT